MNKISLLLNNIDTHFSGYSSAQVAKAKTIFYKKLALKMHRYYGGKMQVIPKAGIYGFNWFNVWYTPGVSSVSTSIRNDNDLSFELTNRGNSVAIVSDSTRVLGDGDCTPPGGLGVMEGKAFLMKYLGGVDASPICVDSRNNSRENDADKLIDFVKMLQHSFGAINLEDISQPNCYRVLDELRESCDIPVWHDDAQGTACVTVAGLINALKLVDKEISKCKIVLLGAGASNTTVAELLISLGADASRIILFDSKGSLHSDRTDIATDERFYKKWDLCQKTNHDGIKSHAQAFAGADILVALSKPGPDVVKPEWISSMNDKAIVFTCANPIPEIYPYAAKEAGAFIVATGRGDFPNQINNSLGFPGILKGALMVRAKKISDNMVLKAAHALADYAEQNNLSPEHIIPTMEDINVFPIIAAEVGIAAIEESLARKILSKDELQKWANDDITQTQKLINFMMSNDFISPPPDKILQDTLVETLAEMERD